jgi:hypothetical protein
MSSPAAFEFMDFWPHHHKGPWADAPPWAIELREMLSIALKNLGAEMVDLSTLAANETKLIADVDTLRAANAKAQSDLAAANTALAAALAANDPAAAAAVQAQIDAIAQALADEDARVAPAPAVAAVTQDTPAS